MRTTELQQRYDELWLAAEQLLCALSNSPLPEGCEEAHKRLERIIDADIQPTFERVPDPLYQGPMRRKSDWPELTVVQTLDAENERYVINAYQSGC